MARKSIFDIASKSLNISNETNRIVKMFSEEETLYFHSRGCTIVEYIDACVFQNWKWRGHFIDVDDFMEGIEYENIVYRGQHYDTESFLTLIELVYNFWELSYRDLIAEDSKLKWSGNFYHLEDVMNDNLQKYNHKAYNCDDRILVIEDKPEVTAVSEIVEQNLAVDVIRYNHRSIKGDLEGKREILVKLAYVLEPKESALSGIDNQFKSDLFYLLNTLGLRHNNLDPEGKQYKAFVANMAEEELEHWYDETYQMCLLAFLRIEHIERKKAINELKKKVEAKDGNT